MKKELKEEETIREMGAAERALRAFGPLGGGLLLDFADLTTFGSLGFYIGPLIGGLLGWWLSTVYRFGLVGQCSLILVAALYCTLPATSLLPLATIVFALIRFAETKKVED